MKYFIVFSCLLAVAYGLPPEIVEKIKEMFKELGEECKAEIGASDDDIAPMKAHELPTTQNGKCFLACMNKKLGFQDGSGKIDKAGSLAQIEKLKPFDADLYGKVKVVTEKCLGEVTDGADECETAYNMMVCYKRESEAAGLQCMEF